MYSISHFYLSSLTLLLLVGVATGCTDSTRGGGELPPMMPIPPAMPDASPMEPDASIPDTPDATTPTPEPPPVSTEATLAGWITRSAAPRAGGRGSVYVALFDRDPVLMRDSAMRVAETVIDDADFSSNSARYEYQVSGIPPRPEPYFIIAFLDDNGTVDPSTPSLAGPDRGDLVSLEGLSSPQVTIATPDRMSMDLDLNFSLPF